MYLQVAIGLLNFLEKGKKVAWTAYLSATVAFQYVFQDPFMKVNKNTMCFELLMGLHVFFRKRQHQSQVYVEPLPVGMLKYLLKYLR